MKLSYKNLTLAAIVAMAGCAGLTSCDKEKIYTTDYEEYIPLGNITFEVSEILPLGVGMDSTLVFTLGPDNAEDKTIIFRSSNEEVATVDQNGTIHALKVGTAIISAGTPMGFGANASIEVQVIPEVIKATEVKLTNVTPPSEDGFIYETDQIQLEAEILPADHTYSRLTWGTSDPEIATVDQKGLVNCIKAGKVTIYCATNDHSGVKGSYELEIVKMVSVDKVTIHNGNLDLTLPGYGIQLDVTYEPATGTTGSVQWTTSDESVATVNRGIVTAVGFGNATITAMCPSTGQSTSIEVNVPVGKYYWGPENKFSRWICSSYNPADHVFGDNDRGDVWRIYFADAKGGKWRRDIKIDCNNNNMFEWHSDYPFYAFRTNLPKGGDNTWDVRDSGNPHDKTGIDLSDGTRLISIDLTGKWDGYHYFNLFQCKVADVPNANVDKDKPYYDIYWIRSFKSKEEAVAFAEAEIKAGK